MTAQAAPSSLPIDDDIHCIDCHYNLRTRTAADRCPECGLAVAQTLEHLKANARAIADPRASSVPRHISCHWPA